MRTILVKDDQCTVLYIFWTCFNIQKIIIRIGRDPTSQPLETQFILILLQLEKVFCKANMKQLSSIEDHVFNYFYVHPLSKHILKSNL